MLRSWQITNADQIVQFVSTLKHDCCRMWFFVTPELPWTLMATANAYMSWVDVRKTHESNSTRTSQQQHLVLCLIRALKRLKPSDAPLAVLRL